MPRQEERRRNRRRRRRRSRCRAPPAPPSPAPRQAAPPRAAPRPAGLLTRQSRWPARASPPDGFVQLPAHGCHGMCGVRIRNGSGRGRGRGRESGSKISTWADLTQPQAYQDVESRCSTGTAHTARRPAPNRLCSRDTPKQQLRIKVWHASRGLESHQSVESRRNLDGEQAHSYTAMDQAGYAAGRLPMMDQA
eukprot:362597-Chlamydomonas_euryale.AAC.1